VSDKPLIARLAATVRIDYEQPSLWHVHRYGPALECPKSCAGDIQALNRDLSDFVFYAIDYAVHFAPLSRASIKSRGLFLR